MKICSYYEPQGGVEGKTLALWGLAFKANTDDVRDAPALEIIDCLTQRGMYIKAYDPQAGKNALKILESNSNVEILDKQYDTLQGTNALAVVTEWNQFRNPDFQRIKQELQAPIIFDGRNLYSPELLGNMGFAYFCIGRAADLQDIASVLPGPDVQERLEVEQ
jgi:UDPglucose 6-dehydrogenase